MVREKCLEWTQSFGVVELDVTKVFDRISHDQILHHLLKSPLRPKLAYLLARELLGGRLRSWAYGVLSDEVHQERGVKQGSPKSGLLFAVILSRVLWRAHQGWEQRRLGIDFFPHLPHLTYVLFADDFFFSGGARKT